MLYQLSYSHHINSLKHWAFGAPGRIRTCDPRLRRPLLYPTELRALACYGRICHLPWFGRGRGIRTPDILLPKQTRYQTALYPASTSATTSKTKWWAVVKKRDNTLGWRTGQRQQTYKLYFHIGMYYG